MTAVASHPVKRKAPVTVNWPVTFVLAVRSIIRTIKLFAEQQRRGIDGQQRQLLRVRARGRAKRPPADMTIRSLQVKLESGARTVADLDVLHPRPRGENAADTLIADDGWTRRAQLAPVRQCRLDCGLARGREIGDALALVDVPNLDPNQAAALQGIEVAATSSGPARPPRPGA
jgi:hypothetical protein